MSPNKTSQEGTAVDSLWYKDAVIYEVHVKTFADSDGDGIGDFPGLTQKLDYLQELGVTAIWLLPFYPSPLRDDGYDIADYTSVHPAYGTLRDFKLFLREAHKRGLKVITELVINHTSDQHEWFKLSRRAGDGEKWRDFYVWSDSSDRYKDARIIFKDFEPSNWTWDATANAYYWHRFYSHQPDLNFDSPNVRKAIFRALDFWLRLGVDGFRLDAVPYLFERDGTSCENLPETHAFLKELRAHVEERYTDRMLLAEANQWPEDAVRYFGDGDECQMAFHFPLMPRLFMAVRMEESYPIVEILRETPTIPDSSQWALFLRNHDELTLEMVTDEDRDYMYRAYAQDADARVNLGIRRRLAPLLGNSRRKIELMTALLFSLPGTPVIYYGDELGMGDNIYLGDRDGVRTPMQWSPDRNAGFSTANPQRLFLPIVTDPEYNYETVNVAAELQNPSSMLWWTRRLISLRKRYPAFGRGSIEFLNPDNNKILAFVRSHSDQTILVVANLSRFVQSVALDLSEFADQVLVEMFGGNRFPPITASPYLLSFGPHSFYWFVLEPSPVAALATAAQPDAGLGALAGLVDWEDSLKGRSKTALEERLPDYLRARRWFGGKARVIRSVQIIDSLPLRNRHDLVAYITLLEVSYREGESEVYVLPIAFAIGEEEGRIVRETPAAAIARVELRDGTNGLLYDAMWSSATGAALLSAILGERSSEGTAGSLQAERTRSLRMGRRPAQHQLTPNLLSAEQSNTSVIFGDRFILKLFRRPDEGTNPDLEIGRFLTEKARYSHSPSVAGFIEYRRGRGQPRTLAILQTLVPNTGDAWKYTLDELGRYYERALALGQEVGAAPVQDRSISDLARDDKNLQPTPILQGQPGPSAAAPVRMDQPSLSEEAIGAYLESARLIGRRTAELHLALASDTDDADFAPESFTPFYQRSLLQSMRGHATNVLQLLRRKFPSLEESQRGPAEEVLALEKMVNDRIQSVLSRNLHATRIRCHGDFHLGQVLYTGSDFVIIDFEGEPARPLSERRVKRSPLRDVAGMVRSFHYAAYAALRVQADYDAELLEHWADFWQQRCSSAFLAAYYEVAEEGGFLPSDLESRAALLDLYLLDKALYELSYELNNRPDWVEIPLRGILHLMQLGHDG